MQKADFMVINFEPTGAVTAMHRDEFSLGFLGKQQIERASEIKFDEHAQSWRIFLPHQQGDAPENWHTHLYLSGFQSYSSARTFEVLLLEHCALQSIAPISTAGMQLAEQLRKDYKEQA